MERDRILLVEDEAETAAFVEVLLRDCGYDVCAVVDNGADAIALAAKHKPDLVVMDIVLPGAMDGIAAAQIIRQQYAVPVVFLTAQTDGGLIGRIKSSGASGYLSKPTTKNGLNMSVETAIYRDRADKELARRTQSLVDANLRSATLTTVLEQLRDADSALQRDGDFEAFYKTIVRHVMDATKAKYGAFGVFGADGNLSAFVTLGMSDDIKAQIGRLPLGGGVLSAVYRGRKLVRIADIREHMSYEGFPGEHPPMTAFLGLPLMNGPTCLGVIYLADKNGTSTFTEWDETLLMIYGAEAVHVLQRAELLAETKRRGDALAERNRDLEESNRRVSETQAQLLQSEKLASIGQLAAGVAHEINNPVGYIGSNVEALRSYVGDLLKMVDAFEAWAEDPQSEAHKAALDAVRSNSELGFIRDDIQQLLTETMEGIGRVRRIVQDLKEFSHVDEGEWEVADLHKGIESTINVVRNEIKYKAELIKEFSDIPLVECLPSQLNQVFMNLLVNAAQAIAEKGTITVRTAWDQLKDQVVVEVQDSGCGITPDHLKRIFDPFFTTKPVGKGTGLGLSVSYGIVAKHHGTIEVNSEVNKGTCFRIRLPVKGKREDDPESIPKAGQLESVDKV